MKKNSKKMYLGFAFFLGFVLGQGHLSFANEVSNDCHDQTTQGFAWTYCISKVQGSSNPDFVYYFHGVEGSARDWVDQSVDTRAHWVKNGEDAPTVVSISFGTAWLLAPQSGSELTGSLFNIVMNVAIPQIEKELGGLKGKRILVGRSMGGFNASEVYLYYSQLFDRVALLCPALSSLSPFASDVDVESFIKESSASSEKVYRARDLARLIFKDEAHWDAVAPLTVGATLLSSKSPRLFVSIGRQDDYGFYAGTEAFVNLARAKGVQQLEWYPVEGKHCSYDADALAEFLVK